MACKDMLSDSRSTIYLSLEPWTSHWFFLIFFMLIYAVRTKWNHIWGRIGDALMVSIPHRHHHHFGIVILGLLGSFQLGGEKDSWRTEVWWVTAVWQDLLAETIHLAKDGGNREDNHKGINLWARLQWRDISPGQLEKKRSKGPGVLTCLAFGGIVRTLEWPGHKGQVSKEGWQAWRDT